MKEYWVNVYRFKTKHGFKYWYGIPQRNRLIKNKDMVYRIYIRMKYNEET